MPGHLGHALHLGDLRDRHDAGDHGRVARPRGRGPRPAGSTPARRRRTGSPRSPRRHGGFDARWATSADAVAGVRVPRGVGGDADAEAPQLLHQAPPAPPRRPEPPRVRGERACPARPAGRRAARAPAAPRPSACTPTAWRSSSRVAPTQVRCAIGVSVVSAAMRRGQARGAVPRGAAGPVGHRHERRVQRLQLPQRPPQGALALVGPRREELEGEGPAARGDGVDDRSSTSPVSTSPVPTCPGTVGHRPHGSGEDPAPGLPC